MSSRCDRDKVKSGDSSTQAYLELRISDDWVAPGTH